eukprot:gene14126-30074_t
MIHRLKHLIVCTVFIYIVSSNIFSGNCRTIGMFSNRFSIHMTSQSTHRVLVSGATGYIGRNVVRELVNRGITVGALTRRGSITTGLTQEYIEGAQTIECDVLNEEDTVAAFKSFAPTATICCLASRSGVSRDAWAVDYEAGYNTLQALVKHGSNNGTAGNFVLLSAYCCGKPKLQFQYAKLKLEDVIRNSPVTHSIVRPTAFFKSLDGQLESARGGSPILLFGDGSCS